MVLLAANISYSLSFRLNLTCGLQFCLFISHYPIMTNPLSNAKLRIPKGFQSLLVGLSTEVLRNQPKNIHAFAADYFEKLVQKRGRIPSDCYID